MVERPLQGSVVVSGADRKRAVERAEQRAESVVQPTAGAGAGRPLAAGTEATRGRWKQREGHHERHQEGESHSQRKVAEELAGQALDVDDRTEDADGRERRRGNGALNLFGALGGCLQPAEPALVVPEDVLQDYDGVVDEHPDAECKTAEAHDVEAHARELHERERGNYADRNGGRDHQRAARVAKEE